MVGSVPPAIACDGLPEFSYLEAKNWSADGFLDILNEKQKKSFKNIFYQNFIKIKSQKISEIFQYF